MDKQVDFFLGTTTCNTSKKSFFTVNTEFAEGEYEWEYTSVDHWGFLCVSRKMPEQSSLIGVRLKNKSEGQ